MTTERRGASRVAQRLPISIAQADGPVQVEAHNLSASGVYCTLHHVVPLMTKLQLQFDVPNGTKTGRIQCEGVVVRSELVNGRSNQYNTAIAFMNLTERSRDAITAFVRQHTHSHFPHPAV